MTTRSLMTDPTLIEHPSPNHGPRPPGMPIDILLFHYTGMAHAEDALARLSDPKAEVSAHYLIDERGRCYRLVPEDRRAWHAGAGSWAGANDINGRSIGIELANPGHEFGYRDFPAPQMAALETLARAILARHPIPRHRVLGHSDVAPTRKQDPGERFDWQRLAHAGIGLWPSDGFEVSLHAPELAPGASGPAAINLQLALSGFGYGVEGTGLYDPTTEAAVAAFQRHFRPARIDGIADNETQSLLHHLLERIPLLD